MNGSRALFDESAIETAARVRERKVSAVEVVTEAFERIESRNHPLRAFVYLDPKGALEAARSVDRVLSAGGDPGLLAGVPFGVKDNMDCAGMPTAHGSLVCRGGEPATADDPLVGRLRAAGAVAVGKTAMPEFGMDSGTASPGWGVTRNPWDLTRTPGGSSGGSAAAVAAGMVPLATGTDMGGSIRSPAAFTGLVGHMPSHGLIPAIPSLELNSVGVLTRNVSDTARVLDLAAGPDPRDRHSLPALAPSFERAIEDLSLEGIRAAWSPDLGYAVVEPGIVAVAKSAAERICDRAGIRLLETGFRPGNIYTLWFALVAFELAHSLRAEGLYPERKAQLAPMTCEIVESLTPDAIEWSRSRRERDRVVAAAAELFDEVDVLFTPTVSCAPYAAEGPIPNDIAGRDASASGAEPFTMLANMTWQPAVSVPAGLDSNALPVGLQIVTPRLRDDLALRIARIAEEELPSLECPFDPDSIPERNSKQ